jgi:uncharacterized protein
VGARSMLVGRSCTPGGPLCHPVDVWARPWRRRDRHDRRRASVQVVPDPDGLDAETLAYAHRMFDLARGGHTTALVEQVDAGLPVNLTNGKGDSLLILAAYYSHVDTVDALLARGADPGRVNDRGQTALAAGVFRQSAPIVAMLLAAGADPRDGGPNAIETARFFDLSEMLALLDADGA